MDTRAIDIYLDNQWSILCYRDVSCCFILVHVRLDSVAGHVNR